MTDRETESTGTITFIIFTLKMISEYFFQKFLEN